jgi:hypothetical protein
MYDAATLAEIQQLRQKVSSGQELTMEEAKRAVSLIRAGRMSAAAAAKTRAAKSPVVDAQSLLDELKGL